MFYNLLAAASAANSWWIYVLLLGLVVVMLVLPMISQKKRYKEYGEMVDGLHVGDEVKTIGGIIGKITKINKEQGAVKSIVVESGLGATKSTLEFDINCIAMVLDQIKVKEEKVEESSDGDASTQPVEKAEKVEKEEPKTTDSKPKKTKSSKK